MNDLIKIDNMLVNFRAFVAVEFQDDIKCIWCYLPRAPIDHQLEYVSFVLDDADKYKEIKSYVEGFILNDYPEGYKPVAQPTKKLGAVDSLTRPPSPVSKPPVPASKPPISLKKASSPFNTLKKPNQ